MSQERNGRQHDGRHHDGRHHDGASEHLLDRPLTARSIVASLLLGMHPPRLSSARLVQWCSLFGVSEGTARVALSRMVERNELTAEAGVYELAGTVRRRQEPQDWVLGPALRSWDGSWLLGVVEPEARPASERGALRLATAAGRLAELREGLWTRPDNLPRVATAPEMWRVLDGQCRWWRGEPEEAAEVLAERLFAPRQWGLRAEHLVAALARVCRGLARGEDEALADGFVVGAAALQHVRRDPLLPEQLLPASWPGAGLREAYERYRVAYGQAVGAWFSGR